MIESTKDSAKFDIKDSEDADDEKKDNIDCIYEVEWRIGDGNDDYNDDEKYEWNKQEFATNTIEVKGLLSETKYGVRCRKKSTENIGSDVSKICWFNTKKATTS